MDSITQSIIDLGDVSRAMDANASQGEYDRGVANGVRLALAALKNEKPDYIPHSRRTGSHEEESE